MQPRICRSTWRGVRCKQMLSPAGPAPEWERDSEMSRLPLSLNDSTLARPTRTTPESLLHYPGPEGNPMACLHLTISLGIQTHHGKFPASPSPAALPSHPSHCFLSLGNICPVFLTLLAAVTAISLPGTTGQWQT